MPEHFEGSVKRNRGEHYRKYSITHGVAPRGVNNSPHFKENDETRACDSERATK